MSPFLPDFDVLSPSIYLQRSSLQQSSPNAPDYIVLLTWMGAKAGHILKYVQGYSSLFPTARIMVITTAVPDMILVSSSSLQRRLDPAMQVLASVPKAKALIHLFSNGGRRCQHDGPASACTFPAFPQTVACPGHGL